MSSDRKAEERLLHDRLRGELAADDRYTANKKYYAITHLNNDDVRSWLTARCRGKRVLDYCCGNGDFTLWLAEAGAKACGIDISPVSIDNARTEAARRDLDGKATFHVMDAESMEFADGSFDFVHINGILHHLDLDAAYSEIARVLTPTGAAICTEALRHNPIIQFYRRISPHLRSAWEVDHILGKSEIERARHWFASVKVERFYHLTTLAAVPFRKLPVFGPMLHALASVDRLFLRVPGLRWQAWIAVFILAQPRKGAAASRATGTSRTPQQAVPSGRGGHYTQRSNNDRHNPHDVHGKGNRRS